MNGWQDWMLGSLGNFRNSIFSRIEKSSEDSLSQAMQECTYAINEIILELNKDVIEQANTEIIEQANREIIEQANREIIIHLNSGILQGSHPHIDIKEHKEFRRHNEITSTIEHATGDFSVQFGMISKPTNRPDNGESDEDHDRWQRSIFFIGAILPERLREEWLGDLTEIRSRMLKEGWSKLWINTSTICRLILLAWALVRLKISDALSPEKKKKSS